MENKHYVVVSAVLSIVSATFFHFWGKHALVGGVLMVSGLLVAGGGFRRKRFEWLVRTLPAGIALVAIGFGILPENAFWGPSGAIVLTAFAGWLLMANPEDSRTYSRQVAVRVVASVTLPVIALMAIVHFGEAFVPGQTLRYLVGIVLIALSGIIAWFTAPNGTDDIPVVPVRQSA